jgi:hypothetical protein
LNQVAFQQQESYFLKTLGNCNKPAKPATH